MPKAIVDGVEVEFDNGMNTLQVCEIAGAEVPRFCYHDRLSVAGNCRMCLVDVELGGRLGPKPTASCSFPASDGMVIHTTTDRIVKARKGVMEFLLINHPLDCPICDQGGECDLQDQALNYGYDQSRYDENKRSVSEKYMGPLIKTIMTRCIQCTRCVRFATEVAGVEEIGLINRGEHAEISTLEQAVSSEMSGNMVDVCPVGALTSKPYAFAARPWELRKTVSVDVMDAVGSNIRVDVRGRDVLRVLPTLNEDINEEWISDKTRHAIDGLRRQRLDTPYVRIDGRLRPATWEQAFKTIVTKLKGLKGDEIGAIAGDQCDAESMFALKSLVSGLGSKNLDCRQDGSTVGDFAKEAGRASYLFNTTIAGLEEADAILLIGTDPRWEAPLINARIRKTFLRGGLKISAIGPQVDLSYEVDWLGNDVSLVSTKKAADALKGAKNPVIIVGQSVLTREDGNDIFKAAAKLAEKAKVIRTGWNGFNVLHTAASRVAGLDMGFLPTKGGLNTKGMLTAASEGKLKALFLLAADQIGAFDKGSSFVVYQGHHGDAGAAMADVILPGAAYTEKNGTYVNTEGRAQAGRIAAFPPGEAREDWTILRALSAQLAEAGLGSVLPFDDMSALRRTMIKAAPSMGALGEVAAYAWKSVGDGEKLKKSEFELPIQNFYHTCPISRASETMAECSDALSATVVKRTGTHG
ncbi:MAG: NADH-quinone oxidoreductase subunit NuoG [Alphaproteobacteria bacterium]